MSTTCIILSAFNLCHGQPVAENHSCSSSIGIDLAAGLCFGTVRLMAGHSINSNWSAGFDVGLDMAIIKSPPSILESEHSVMMSDDRQPATGTNKFRHTFQDICIHMDYWIFESFKGLHLCIGGLLKDRGGPDLLLGAGYSIRIWKGLCTDITYRFGIIETYKAGHLPLEGIKAGLHYEF